MLSSLDFYLLCSFSYVWLMLLSSQLVSELVICSNSCSSCLLQASAGDGESSPVHDNDIDIENTCDVRVRSGYRMSYQQPNLSFCFDFQSYGLWDASSVTDTDMRYMFKSLLGLANNCISHNCCSIHIIVYRVSLPSHPAHGPHAFSSSWPSASAWHSS